jgi:valyl-tRNA synthetase
MPELPKTYDPNDVEPKWYARWEEAGYFRADAQSSKPPYSIVIPPPNVTGILTMGHVLNNTIQDILARRARMQGFEVLWMPGTDHAGVGTQTAVEKHLRKTENKSRHDVGREEFLRRVVDWQDKHGGIIIQQLKRLGASCDWSRQRYTFDDDYVRAVESVFVDLYQKGLIYRGRRMINWDPAAQTSLSDEEVISQPQKGKLYYVRYEMVDEPTPARVALTRAGSPPPRFIEVATTRPETIMADTAIAVHPDDPRYQSLIGMQVWRPLAREKLPVIGDAAIDPKFGTGVLKVTPAHDKLDFEIGVRHSLPVIDVLHPDGRINCPAVPELDGMERFAARQKAAELLAEAKLLAKEEPHENSVGFSQRSEVPIEPRLSEQWFLRYPKTKEALDVVRERLIRFFPPHWEKVYAQWLENIQDWCISRQIWWGHRIPAWYRKSQLPEPRSQADENIYVGMEPPPDPENWTQDPDTLDTWFSSWLWAYETMDDETRRKFYPTAVLVTAADIIFFWVARMIIAGLEFMPGKSKRLEDNIPFRDVFLTGLIRDKHGVKMSKSKGNSPDPLDLIAKYGADGLRFGLMRIAPSGQDFAFDEKQIEEGRNFATKIWNAARFRQMHGPSEATPRLDGHALSIYSIEVLARFNELLTAVEDAYREYKFNEVAQRLYDFFWGDYCDWFIEAAKTDIFSEDEKRKASVLAVMDFVLSGVLRLLHPFMPHITEELWDVLGLATGGLTIQFENLPKAVELDTSHRGRVRDVYETVKIGRNLRSHLKIPSNKKTRFLLRSTRDWISSGDPTIARLLNASSFEVSNEEEEPIPRSPLTVTPLGELLILDDYQDKTAERERLDKEIVRLEGEVRTVEAKLSNASFVERAPAAVVEEHRKRQADFSDQLAQLRQARAAMD